MWVSPSWNGNQETFGELLRHPSMSAGFLHARWYTRLICQAVINMQSMVDNRPKQLMVSLCAEKKQARLSSECVWVQKGGEGDSDRAVEKTWHKRKKTTATKRCWAAVDHTSGRTASFHHWPSGSFLISSSILRCFSVSTTSARLPLRLSGVPRVPAAKPPSLQGRPPPPPSSLPGEVALCWG